MNTLLKISDKAKNGTFEECQIFGGVENSGTGINFKSCTIGIKEYANTHPILYGTFSAIIGGIFTLIIKYSFFSKK